MTWCLYQQVQYLNMDTIFHSAPKMFWQKELYKLVSILFLNTFFSPSVNSVAEVMITGTNWSIFFCKSCQKILSWCYCPAIILIHSGFCKVWESLLPPVQYFVLPIQNWGSHFPNVEASVFRCKFNNKQRMTSRYWSRHVASQRWLTLRVTLHLLKQTSLYHFGDVVCKEIVYSPPPWCYRFTLHYEYLKLSLAYICWPPKCTQRKTPYLLIKVLKIMNALK